MTQLPPGFNPNFHNALAAMFAAAPEDVRGQLKINSGHRSIEKQAQLWEQALVKYGSPEAARKWVAPPGRSNHNHGLAADLGYASPMAREWVHSNAQRFGLAFPLKHENWHIELASARGGAPSQNPPSPSLPTGGAALVGGVPPSATEQPPVVADSGGTNLAEQFFTMQQETRAQQDAKKRRLELLFGTA